MKKFLLEILNKLENNGFEAYIVGGYVRDYLLNIESYDIDICTSAKLDDLKFLFKNTTVYESFWAIKIKHKRYTININTYRRELEYKNNKPIKLEYVSSLKEDLIRRDFTINSMCFDEHFNLIDLCGSKKDLDNRIIKVIGKTKDRLDEDKTRILRAIRLSCLLDFKLDKEIVDYIKNNREFLNYISINKYKEELDKIILKGKFSALIKFIKDNELNDIFKFKDIINVNTAEGIYSQLEMRDDFPFTRKEKNIIKIFKNIIISKTITDSDIFKLGLKNSLVIAKIINENEDNIKIIYNKIKKSL